MALNMKEALYILWYLFRAKLNFQQPLEIIHFKLNINSSNTQYHNVFIVLLK